MASSRRRRASRITLSFFSCSSAASRSLAFLSSKELGNVFVVVVVVTGGETSGAVAGSEDFTSVAGDDGVLFASEEVGGGVVDVGVVPDDCVGDVVVGDGEGCPSFPGGRTNLSSNFGSGSGVVDGVDEGVGEVGV